MIEELPEDITVSDIMAELYFRQNVDEGLKELAEGKGISHEEAKKKKKKTVEPMAKSPIFTLLTTSWLTKFTPPSLQYLRI